MVELEWAWTRREGVTFVSARVHNDGVDRRVRIDSRLDGPVWPPRRDGVPESGWTDDGFEGVVPAGETRAIGFATPAEPVDPPVTVVARERVDADDSGASDGADPAGRPADVPRVDGTEAAVLRALGDPVIPRAAVPAPSAGVDGVSGTESDASCPAPESGGRHSCVDDGHSTARSGDSVTNTRAESGAGNPRGDDRSLRAVPPAVREWLSAVERKRAVADSESARAGTGTLAAVRADEHALLAVRRRLDALLARRGEKRAEQRVTRTESGWAGRGR